MVTSLKSLFEYPATEASRLASIATGIKREVLDRARSSLQRRTGEARAKLPEAKARLHDVYHTSRDIVAGRSSATPWGTRDRMMKLFELINRGFETFSDAGTFPKGKTVDEALDAFWGTENPLQRSKITIDWKGQPISLEVFDSMPSAKDLPTDQKPVTVCFFPGLTTSVQTLLAPHMRFLMQQMQERGIPVRLVGINFPAHHGSDTPPVTADPGKFQYDLASDLPEIMLQALRVLGVDEYISTSISMGYIVPLHAIVNKIEHPKLIASVAQSTATEQPGVIAGAFVSKEVTLLLEILEKHFGIDKRYSFYVLMLFCGHKQSRVMMESYLAQMKNPEVVKAWVTIINSIAIYRREGKMISEQEFARQHVPNFHAAGGRDIVTPKSSVMRQVRRLRRAGIPTAFLFAPEGHHTDFEDQYAGLYALLGELVTQAHTRKSDHAPHLYSAIDYTRLDALLREVSHDTEPSRLLSIMAHLGIRMLDSNANLVEQWSHALEELNDALGADNARFVLKALQGRRALCVTGTANIPETRAYANTFATAYGAVPNMFEKDQIAKGAPRFGILGISSADGVQFKPSDGLYVKSGVGKLVGSDDYMNEVLPLLLRIFVFIKQDPSKPVDLYGYSKGGMLVEDIKAMADAYKNNGNRIPDELFKLLPGLERVKNEVAVVFDHMNEHQSLAIGLATPGGGVSEQLSDSVMGASLTLLLGGGAIDSLYNTNNMDRLTKAGLNPHALDRRLFGSISEPGIFRPWLTGTDPSQEPLLTAILAAARLITLEAASHHTRPNGTVVSSDGVAPILDEELSNPDQIVAGVDHLGMWFLPYVAAKAVYLAAKKLNETKKGEVG